MKITRCVIIDIIYIYVTIENWVIESNFENSTRNKFSRINNRKFVININGNRFGFFVRGRKKRFFTG